MNVQIFLDRPQQQFTNLDVITGSVRLHVPTSSNVSNVLVKLEGESRTRLVAPRDELGRERPRPVLEVHKVHIHQRSSEEHSQRCNGYPGVSSNGRVKEIASDERTLTKTTADTVYTAPLQSPSRLATTQPAPPELRLGEILLYARRRLLPIPL